MITELEIQSFKTLKNVTLPDLKRITLIGGKNNTGKTSVLEAFFLSLDWGHADQIARHLRWRGVEAMIQNPDSVWSPAFSNFDLSRRIQVKTKGDQGTQVFTAQVANAPVSSTTGGASGSTQSRSVGEPTLRLSFTRGSRSIFEAKVTLNPGDKGPNPYSMKVDKAEGKAPVAYYTVARNRPSAMDDATMFGILDTEKRAEPVTDALKILVPGLKSISVVPLGAQSQLYADIEGLPKKIPVNLLGDGTTRLLSMLLHVSSARSGYFLVDEIENGFHYTAMPTIWKTVYSMCKANKCQMLATTHSYECLTAYASALKDLAGDDYSYVRFDSDGEALRVVPYDAVSLQNATESGWEVR